MSTEDRQGGAGRREVAWRLFAAEYDDATFEYSEADEERAPNYVVTPTGARVNRLFVVGVLTEIEPVTDDVLRARIVDPTGAFVVYAGQYQPDAVAFLEDADIPSYVAVTGKARTYQPEGSDRVFTSVRPESVNLVDADTRDRWTVQTAAHTAERVATMAAALGHEDRGEALARTLIESGVDVGLASGIPLAIEHYGTTEEYLESLRRVAIDAARVVAGEVDEVEPLGIEPNEGGAVSTDLAADAELVAETVEVGGEAVAEPTGDTGATSAAATVSEPSGAAGEVSGGSDDGEDRETTAPTVELDADVESGEGAGAADVGAAETAETAEASEVAEPTEPEETGDPTEPEETGDEEFELDEAERDRLEATYGTEFSTGTEVDGPGEADIETPDEAGGPPSTADAEADEAVEAAEEPEPDAEPATAADAESEAPADDATGDDEDEAAVDLESAVVDAMREADDGDGADREAVVETVAAAHDVDPATVEDAIQDALMSGKCYEPAEGRLKAI